MGENTPGEIIRITLNDLSEDIVLTEADLQQAATEYMTQNPGLDFTKYEDIKLSDGMKFYDRLRHNIIKWAEGKGNGSKYIEIILLAPDFFLLLVRLMMDNRVQPQLRLILAGLAAYFISPIDPMPEAFLGPVGYLDDIVFTTLGILNLLKNTDESIIREHWSGKGDIVALVKKVSNIGETLVGTPLWMAMKQKLKGNR